MTTDNRKVFNCTSLRYVHSKQSEQLVIENFETLRGNFAAQKKETSPLWSPIKYKDGQRKSDAALEVCALVFDFDSGRPDSPLQKLGVEHYWHTTHSHTGEHPKWRLIVPLDKPIKANQWRDFYVKAASLLGFENYDASCSDLAQFFYIPPPDAQWEKYEGALVPSDEILKYKPVDTDLLRTSLLRASNPDYKEAIRLALAGKPLAKPGERDSKVTGLGYYLGKFVVDISIPLAAVISVLGKGLSLPGDGKLEQDKPREHWVKKFQAAFERGRLERETKSKENSLPEGDWKGLLQTAPRMDGSSKIISNAHNVAVIMRHDGTWQARKNLLEDSLEIFEGSEWRRLSDADCTKISVWFQEKWLISVPSKGVLEHLELIAAPYDPLRHYLDSLEWDGVSRIDDFLSNYLGCADSPLLNKYSRKWLIGLVARALTPGCKMDTVLVLKGPQGFGKSTAMRLLTEPWFSDSKVIIGDKDSMLQASRFWCHEFAELASFKRSDLETIKAFFTSPEDAFRPSYGRVIVVKPRRCVFVATTNEEEFLQDETGARRFWVVEVTRPLDFDAIRRDRGQLFAEAIVAYRKGESHWLDREEAVAHESVAEEYQQQSYSLQLDELERWWFSRPKDARPKYLTTAVVIRDIFGISIDKATRPHELMVASVLRRAGFKRSRTEGKRVWVPMASKLFLDTPSNVSPMKAVS